PQPRVVLRAIADQEPILEQHFLGLALFLGRRLLAFAPALQRFERAAVDAGVSIIENAIEDVLAGPDVLVSDDEARQVHLCTDVRNGSATSRKAPRADAGSQLSGRRPAFGPVLRGSDSSRCASA